ncbi:MAG: KH domain-containing protein, partial [Candidatus Hodarchaeales archaeon]
MNTPIDSDFSDLEMQEVVRVPNDRIGVVIGKKGNTKLKIEEFTSTILTINSEENSIIIKPKKKIKDPSLIWVAKDMIRAIGRGFNEKIAFSLIDPDVFLRIITIEDNRSKKRVERIRGRIIGESGRTRRVLEEITRCNVSI